MVRLIYLEIILKNKKKKQCMKNNNFLWLLLVVGFLILSTLSFYWFNSVEQDESTHSFQSNPMQEGIYQVWYNFSSVISFLDIIGNNNNKKEVKTEESFTLGDIGIKKKDKNEENNKKEEVDINNQANTSASQLIENKKIEQKEWYKNLSSYLSKKGFYSLKIDNKIELGWQSKWGKIYNIKIPY